MDKHHLSDMADALVAEIPSRLSKGELRRRIMAVLAGYWCDKMAIVWTVNDVIENRSQLTEEEGMDILEKVLDDHDCTCGVTWDTINSAAITLFGDRGREDEGEEPE